MNDDKTIMKIETTLPEDFDGTFRFTNWTKEDFTAKWDGQEYTFPAQTTSALIIPEEAALHLQQIRKKFAKELAEREFAKGPEYKKFLKQERNSDNTPRANSIHQAGSYNIDVLTPLIQACLEPLTFSKAVVKTPVKPKLEESLSRNEEGELNTKAIGGRDRQTGEFSPNSSLRQKAIQGEGF